MLAVFWSVPSSIIRYIDTEDEAGYAQLVQSKVSVFVFFPTLSFFSSFFDPFLLYFPATWHRTHLSVTVIWSGWPTTCAPTPLRPAAPAVPALAVSQTNASDRSRARSSAAPVCRRLHNAVSKRLFFLSQTGFVVFTPLVSHCSLTFSLPLLWEWLLSLPCSLHI